MRDTINKAKNIIMLIGACLFFSALNIQNCLAIHTKKSNAEAMGKSVYKRSETFQRTLSIGGTELITLRGDTQESLDKRADIVYDRLNYILAENDLKAEDIVIVMEKNDPVLYVRKHLLITVTSQDATYNQLTQEKQSQIWHKRFCETLPELSTKSKREGE
jgi:hypothetical protein